MNVSMGPWLITSPPLDCPSDQPLWGVPKPNQRLGSSFMFRNGPWKSLVVSFTLISSLIVIRMAGCQLEVIYQYILTLGRRVAMGDVIPDVLQSSASSQSSSCVVQIGTLSKFLYQWRSITSNRIVLNMVKVYHTQFRCHHQLFCNFSWLT